MTRMPKLFGIDGLDLALDLDMACALGCIYVDLSVMRHV